MQETNKCPFGQVISSILKQWNKHDLDIDTLTSIFRCQPVGEIVLVMNKVQRSTQKQTHG